MTIIEQTESMPSIAKYRVKSMNGERYLFFTGNFGIPSVTDFNKVGELPTSNHSGWDYSNSRIMLSEWIPIHIVPETDVLYWKNSLVEISPNELLENHSEKQAPTDITTTYKIELNRRDNKLSQYKRRIHDFTKRATAKNIRIKALEDEIAILNNTTEHLNKDACAKDWKTYYLRLLEQHEELENKFSLLQDESCTSPESLLDNLSQYCVQILDNNSKRDEFEEKYNKEKVSHDLLKRNVELIRTQLDSTEQHLRSAENALQYKEHVILFLKGEIADGWDKKDY